MASDIQRKAEEFARREAGERQRRIADLDRFASERDRWRAKNAAYYRAVERLVGFVVPPNASVLEVGCGTGDLLAGLKPARGVGVDISPRLIDEAQRKHPLIDF